MSPLCNWLIANTVVISTGLVAAGAVVNGPGGALTITGDVNALGLAMATGAGDPSGTPQWTAIATAVVEGLRAQAAINPTALVANPAGGAVTGVPALAIANKSIGPSIRAAIPATDAPSIAPWSTIGAIILTHIESVTIITAAFTSPSGGGPVVGVGALT